MSEYVTATPDLALTTALRRVWPSIVSEAVAADLLFLERWERNPLAGTAAALRVAQLRRANPVLAAEIRAEIDHGRALTTAERQKLGSPTP